MLTQDLIVESGLLRALMLGAAVIKARLIREDNVKQRLIADQLMGYARLGEGIGLHLLQGFANPAQLIISAGAA